MVYTTQEIEDRLADLPGWSLDDDGKLAKTLTLKNFGRAMLFAGAVGHLAEAANHHPDLFVHDYKNVTVSLMTHSEGGITDKDFDLASQIESLPQAG